MSRQVIDRPLVDEALGMCTPGRTLLAHAKGPFKSCILTAERCLVHDFLAMKTIIRRHVGRRKAKPLPLLPLPLPLSIYCDVSSRISRPHAAGKEPHSSTCWISAWSITKMRDLGIDWRQTLEATGVMFPVVSMSSWEGANWVWMYLLCFMHHTAIFYRDLYLITSHNTQLVSW